MVFWNDVLLKKGGGWSEEPIVNAADGQPNTSLGELFLGSGCGAFTLSANLLCGQWGVTHDFKAGQPLVADRTAPLSHKTPCLAGPLVAEGRVLYGNVTCVCGSFLRGTVVQTPAVNLPANLNTADRLYRAPDSDRVRPCPPAAVIGRRSGR